MNMPPAESTRRSSSSRWVHWFGPGAIIASLTIGSGELIFSTRGGALFGYRLVGVFLLICLFKWTLVIATARHMVLTGAHPLQRWMELPGPRGWLPLMFALVAVFAFPIWVGFHAGTVGTLLATLTRSEGAFGGGSHFVWGMASLLVMLALSWTGGYGRLERIQMILVLIMLLSISYSLLIIRPHWMQALRESLGIFRLQYPAWVVERTQFQNRPLWVELATYVGVIGGSGYDYLAYVSFLRNKQWGAAGGPVLSDAAVNQIAQDPHHSVRSWLIAPFVDASVSFGIVLFFSAVFLACGTEILRPQHKLPAGDNLLTLQAEFVSLGSPRLRPMYFAGALLAMLGTLYGTIEVAPTVAREVMRGFDREHLERPSFHRWVTGWVGAGGLLVLGYSLFAYLRSGTERPASLIEMLTPANLLTGVLACGIISWLSIDADRRHLPSALRPRPWLVVLNAVGGLLFLLVGFKAFWDHGGTFSLGALLVIGVISVALAAGISRRRKRNDG